MSWRIGSGTALDHLDPHVEPGDGLRIVPCARGELRVRLGDAPLEARVEQVEDQRTVGTKMPAHGRERGTLRFRREHELERSCWREDQRERPVEVEVAQVALDEREAARHVG